MMKYALNHPYKFRAYHHAFFCGLVQFFVAIMCELLNYLYLMQAEQAIDICSNFLSLYIISQLDEYYYRALMSDKIKNQMTDKFVNKLLTVVRTTSSKAEIELNQNKIGASKAVIELNQSSIVDSKSEI